MCADQSLSSSTKRARLAQSVEHQSLYPRVLGIPTFCFSTLLAASAFFMLPLDRCVGKNVSQQHKPFHTTKL